MSASASPDSRASSMACCGRSVRTVRSSTTRERTRWTAASLSSVTLLAKGLTISTAHFMAPRACHESHPSLARFLLDGELQRQRAGAIADVVELEPPLVDAVAAELR